MLSRTALSAAPALAARLAHPFAVPSVELEGDAAERKARSVKLPKLIKTMPMAQLRVLLRTAEVPDQQCTNRPQLIVRLKQIEKQSRQGSGLSVAQLIAKAGLDGKGKRASPEAAASTAAGAAGSQGRPKRLRRANVQYVRLDSGEEDADEVRPLFLMCSFFYCTRKS
jgi:hypothetical protein